MKPKTPMVDATSAQMLLVLLPPPHISCAAHPLLHLGKSEIISVAPSLYFGDYKCSSIYFPVMSMYM